MAKKMFYKKRRFYKRKTYSNSNKRPAGIPKTIASDIVYRKCEHYNNIMLKSGHDDVEFTNGLSSLNVTTILQGSETFLNTQGDYMRFKIYGILVEAFSSAPDQRVSLHLGSYPVIRCAFYPHEKSINKGSRPLSTDSGFTINSKNNYARKYYALPEGFMNSNNTTTVGNWNEASTYGTMDGQFSVYAAYPKVTASADVGLCNVKITMYVAFSGQII